MYLGKGIILVQGIGNSSCESPEVIIEHSMFRELKENSRESEIVIVRSGEKGDEVGKEESFGGFIVHIEGFGCYPKNGKTLVWSKSRSGLSCAK